MQARNAPVGFHEGGNSGMMQVGMGRFEERGARHIITHTMEMMLAGKAVIWGGVCERHPKVRIAFLESGGGWIGPWLDRPMAGSPHGWIAWTGISTIRGSTIPA